MNNNIYSKEKMIYEVFSNKDMNEEKKKQLIDEFMEVKFSHESSVKQNLLKDFTEKGNLLIESLKKVNDLPVSLKSQINELEDTQPMSNTIHHVWRGETQESAQPVREYPMADYERINSDDMYQYVFNKAKECLTHANNLNTEKNLIKSFIHEVRSLFNPEKKDNTNKPT